MEAILAIIISAIAVLSFIAPNIKNFASRAPAEPPPVEKISEFEIPTVPVATVPPPATPTPASIRQNQPAPQAGTPATITHQYQAAPTPIETSSRTQTSTSATPPHETPAPTQTPSSAPIPTPPDLGLATTSSLAPTPEPTPTPTPEPTPPQETVGLSGSEITSRLADLNKPFIANKNTSAPSDAESYVLESGSGKVLISAPHSANQIREGNTKDVDYCTGAIAKLLKERTGAHLIYFPYKSTDPNYYDNVPYKKALAAYLAEHSEINLVLDIHGADRSRPWDIDLGDMNGKSLFKFKDLSGTLEEIFKANGINTISRNFFAGEYQATVTKFVAARNKDAVQIEINRAYRCDEESKNYKLINSLYQTIKKYK